MSRIEAGQRVNNVGGDWRRRHICWPLFEKKKMRRILGKFLGGVSSSNGEANRVRKLQEVIREAVASSSPQVESIMAALNEIEPDDVGLTQSRAALRADGREVGYVPLVECEDYHWCIFVLGPRASITLHDHPNMTVLSRVLAGSVDISAFDKTDTSFKAYEIMTLTAPCEAIATFPDRRNIHSFVAGPEGAAILDVIFPPYNDEDRNITYFYQVIDEHEKILTLTVASPEPDFDCVSLPYRGLELLAD